MPVVELILGVAGQLQLTHILAEPKPVSRIVESGDLPDALEHPLRIRRPRNPEQITVSDQTAIAPRHPALERTRFLMDCNDTLALLRAEPTREDLAVIKSFPHVGRPIGVGPQLRLDRPEADPLREPDGGRIYRIYP